MHYFPVLYPYLFYFAVYSFLGWGMETILVSCQKKKVVNRGFFIGPYCPIYGVGVCILIVCSHYIQSFWQLFIIAGLVATAVELMAGLILQHVFHARWWNYDHKKFNIKGLVCPAVSFCWAFLAVLVLRFMQPFVAGLFQRIPYAVGRYGVAFLILLICTDSLISGYSMLSLKAKAKAVAALNERWNRFIAQNNIALPQNWMTEFGEDFAVDAAKREMIHFFSEEYQRIQNKNQKLNRRIENAYTNKK